MHHFIFASKDSWISSGSSHVDGTSFKDKNFGQDEILEVKKYFCFDRMKTGGVDGATMDENGGYWAALYGGSKLIRVLPNGELDKVISLPVSQPTMPTFGGQNMKTIFVTASRKDLSDQEQRAQPMAGGLFSIPVDVKGHQVYTFGG